MNRRRSNETNRSLLAAVLVFALRVVGCARQPHAARAIAPGATVTRVAVAGESFDLAWRAPFDSQSGLLVFGTTIVESGWQGIIQHDVADGRERGRFAGSDDTFRAWIGVDAAHDPVLVHLGSFVLGRDRRARLARFDPPREPPRWISGACTRLYAAALAGDEIVAFCGSGTAPPAPFPPGALVFLDAATGRERARVSLPATSPFDEHAVIAAHGVIAVRAGEHVLIAEATPRILVDRVRPGTFALAATEHGLAIVENGAGLIEFDAATGADLRTIGLSLRGTPDPFTTRLGRLVIAEGTAYVEAGGEIRALSLADGRERWRAEGGGIVIDRERVYACRGNHFVVLDARSGAERFAYSTGTCAVVGVAGSRVLVRFEALPARSTRADLVWAGVLAFERRAAAPPPCERATLRGVVRVNGAIAPGLTVRAGNAWFAESNGVVHLWGGPMTPTREPAAASAQTDNLGRYTLTFCERGHVPIVVDAAQARRMAGEQEAGDFSAYVHLDGSGTYTVDFAVSAHGPTL